MATPSPEPKTESNQEFSHQAEQAQPGILLEFWDFLRHNKKWWLTPIILVLLLMGAMVIIAWTSPAAPFIYTLF